MINRNPSIGGSTGGTTYQDLMQSPQGQAGMFTPQGYAANYGG
jgi:hypothetical protein